MGEFGIQEIKYRNIEMKYQLMNKIFPTKPETNCTNNSMIIDIYTVIVDGCFVTDIVYINPHSLNPHLLQWQAAVISFV